MLLSVFPTWGVEGVHRKALGSSSPRKGLACRPEGWELPAGLLGIQGPEGGRAGGVCVQYVQERKEGNTGMCSTLHAWLWREHKPAAGARAVVKSRKPERNKNGRKTLWSRAGFCILVTQRSVRPNVKYVWLLGHWWGLETSMWREHSGRWDSNG